MVSILIPIYNGIEYLHECLESVKAQTFTDWECIIGMNGIKDEKIKDLIKLYADDKIRVIDYTFKGKVNTLNKMLYDAEYDWIALLDCDDKWHAEKLEKQVKCIDDFYDVIGTGCQYFGDKSNHPNIPFGKLSKKDFAINPIINSSVIMKKTIAFWNKEFKVCEDFEMWVRLINEGCRFYNISDVLTYHRIHKSSFFNNQDQTEAIEKIKKMLDL